MKNIRINRGYTDKILSAALLVFCGLVLLQIRHFSEYGRYFPNIVTLFLLIFCFVFFLRSWVPILRKKDDGNDPRRIRHGQADAHQSEDQALKRYDEAGDGPTISGHDVPDHLMRYRARGWRWRARLQL